MLLWWDVKSEANLDERLKRRLLDEATQQSMQSHAEASFSVAPKPPHQNPKEATKLPPFLPPAGDMTRKEPPYPVEPGGCHPVVFLAQPRGSESGRRRMKQKQSNHMIHPRRRDRHNRQMGMLQPTQWPASPVQNSGVSRKATAPDSESPPGQTLTLPDVAMSWAIVPADPPQAAVRSKRSRLQAVPLPTKKPERAPKSESDRNVQRADRVNTESGSTACTCRVEERVKNDVSERRHGRARSSRGPSRPRRQFGNVRHGRSRKMDLLGQRAELTNTKDPSDRRFPAKISCRSSAWDCSTCTPPKKEYPKQIRGAQFETPDQTVRYLRSAFPRAHRVPSTHQSRRRQTRGRPPRRETSAPTSSETSYRARSSTTPSRRASSGSSSRCSSGAAPRRKAHRRTASRRDAMGTDQRRVQRETYLSRCNSSSRRVALPVRPSPQLMIPRKRTPKCRPIVKPRRSKATGATAIAKGDHGNKKPEKKDGRLRRLKDRLGLVFHHHHHHHHYHHHRPPSDADEHSGGGRPERRHHRSLRELLQGILHHSGGGKQEAAGARRRPPQQGQPHGYLHMLLEGLLRHLWRGPKRRKQRPAKEGGASGRAVPKKLHWWQKIRRRRRGLRLASRRRPRLRLGFGRKASVGRGGGKKKK